MAEQEMELQYTLHITVYGSQDKCQRQVGQTLSRLLTLAFGKGRYRLVGHINHSISYDPDVHDFGIGET